MPTVPDALDPAEIGMESSIRIQMQHLVCGHCKCWPLLIVQIARVRNHGVQAIVPTALLDHDENTVCWRGAWANRAY